MSGISEMHYFLAHHDCVYSINFFSMNFISFQQRSATFFSRLIFYMIFEQQKKSIHQINLIPTVYRGKNISHVFIFWENRDEIHDRITILKSGEWHCPISVPQKPIFFSKPILSFICSQKKHKCFVSVIAFQHQVNHFFFFLFPRKQFE